MYGNAFVHAETPAPAVAVADPVYVTPVPEMLCRNAGYTLPDKLIVSYSGAGVSPFTASVSNTTLFSVIVERCVASCPCNSTWYGNPPADCVNTCTLLRTTF